MTKLLLLLHDKIGKKEPFVMCMYYLSFIIIVFRGFEEHHSSIGHVKYDIYMHSWISILLKFEELSCPHDLMFQDS
jgi:hypothetical protein